MIAGQIHISLCVVVVFCFWAGLGCGPQPASRDDFSRNAYDTPVGMLPETAPEAWRHFQRLWVRKKPLNSSGDTLLKVKKS